MCTLSSDASCLNIKLLCLKVVSVVPGLGANVGLGGDMSAQVGAGVHVGLGVDLGIDLGVGVGVTVTVSEDASLGVGVCFALSKSLTI